MSLSFSWCQLSWLTTTINWIGTKFYQNMDCFWPSTWNFTEMARTTWTTTTGSNTTITWLITNQLYMWNCVVSKTSATFLTWLTCRWNLHLITGAVGATGNIWPTGAVGATGNIQFTISWFTLSELSWSTITWDSVIVNNVVDYSQLTQSIMNWGSIALVLILVLLSITFIIRKSLSWFTKKSN